MVMSQRTSSFASFPGELGNGMGFLVKLMHLCRPYFCDLGLSLATLLILMSSYKQFFCCRIPRSTPTNKPTCP